MVRQLAVFGCLFIFAAVSIAEDKPADPKAAPAKEDKAEAPKFHISSPIVKDIEPIEAFICGEAETNFEQFMDTLSKTFFPLMEKEGENGTVFQGAPIFIYHGASQDPAKKFKFTAGYAVAPDAKPIGEYKIKKIDGYRCLSVYYTGSLETIDQAYMQLFAQVARAGHTPTGQTRELYLDWHGEASPNTVVEVQVGIAAEKKDAKE